MKIAEVFGTSVQDQSSEADAMRAKRWCRFRDCACAKVSKESPVGVCSLSSGPKATIVCPYRFVEGLRVFRDASKIAFGPEAKVVVIPEYKLLTVIDAAGGRDRKIGKVDYMLAKLDGDVISDFAALEIQAVYSSGGGVQSAFKHFMQTRYAGEEGGLGVDFRSSAQKRLVPQLRLKVPIFRRWGKKFFVAIDDTFFSALPTFGTTSPGNSELTWLAYPLRMNDSSPLALSDPQIHYTEWNKVEQALEEGIPPASPTEVIAELQARVAGKGLRRLPVLQT